MKFTLFSFLLVFTLIGFTGCEQTATYEVPAIADQFISFTIDGQSMTLSSVPNQGYEPNSLYLDETTNSLSLSRNSTDMITTLTINAQDLPLERKANGISILRQVFVPAIITVLSTEMTGSIYCPHTSSGPDGFIQYQGLVRVEELTEDGHMKGSFKTDPSATDNAVSISDGTFELIVPIH